MIEDRERQLFDVALARAPSGRFAGRLHGRQEQADERADDGDHDQEFDQRESTVAQRGAGP
jgi:hypothetical protein